MKTLYFLFVFAVSNLLSQGWQENIKDPANFYSIREAFLERINSDKIEMTLKKAGEEGEEEQFRRFEFMLEPRVYPTGKFPRPTILLDEWNKFKALNQTGLDTITGGNWTPLESPSGFPYEGYSGRLNCIAFHPLDTNIMYVGSPAGGLWETTTGGKSWIPLADYLPSLGVSEIVIQPDNPNIMYMATGDRDAANFISNPYSYGLLKSTNGGETWDTTGLNYLFSDQMTIQRLVMHPDNPNILMAAVEGVDGNKRGIWRTTDAGVSWTKTSGGAKYDVEFNPGDPNIMYAAGWKSILRSTDAGMTWIQVKSNILPTDSISEDRISVTAANPHLVYLQYLNSWTGGTYGLYKSGDDGLTWEMVNQEGITTQGGYDWVLAVSPIDTNIVLYGGQYLFGSYDGGKNQLNFQSGHVDHHDLIYHPKTKALFNCNDGGIYKSWDNGETWENLNKSLQTFQYYRMGASATNKDFILTGAQDNGTQIHDFLSWQQIGILADGMECLVDYSDPAIYYVSYQYGYLMRFGAGENFSFPPNAFNSKYYAWVTPYIIHPSEPATLFIGGKDIYKSNDRGNTWVAISNKLTANDGVGGGMLRTMAISESNPDSILYAASYVVAYKTTNAGVTWHNITSNLPTSAGCFDCSAISSIAVHPINPNIAWVAMSGYSPTNKVFKTTDGGETWVNISENLPAIPVNTIVYQKNSKDVLYIGTDLGIFCKDSTDKNWKPFMNGLPNVPVQELEIHYCTQKLRAATFGRGLWETDLYGAVVSVDDNEEQSTGKYLYPNPANGSIELPDELINKNSRLIIYSSIGIAIYEGNATKRIDISSISPGIYLVKVKDRLYKFVKM
ncbi:MAG: T9SS type A sorting domain-containing protein [Bacteroidetes bacterium]|nr:MAG: T9SS type A sorting domain-containing protein [Bacteroidota bacterium]